MWYRDKSEALATETEIAVSDKVETFPETTLCHIVISDAAPCQMSLKMAFTFNGMIMNRQMIGNQTHDSNVKRASQGLRVPTR